MPFAAGGGSTCSPLLHRKHRGDLPVPSPGTLMPGSDCTMFFSRSWRSACHQFVCLVPVSCLATSIFHSSLLLLRDDACDDARCLGTHCRTCSTRQKKQNNSHTPNFSRRPRHQIANLSLCLWSDSAFEPLSATGLSGPTRLNLCSLIPALLWWE